MRNWPGLGARARGPRPEPGRARDPGRGPGPQAHVSGPGPGTWAHPPPNISKRFQTFPNISKHFQTLPNNSKHVLQMLLTAAANFPKISKHFQTLSKHAHGAAPWAPRVPPEPRETAAGCAPLHCAPGAGEALAPGRLALRVAASKNCEGRPSWRRSWLWLGQARQTTGRSCARRGHGQL